MCCLLSTINRYNYRRIIIRVRSTAVVTIIYISRNQNNSKNDKAKVNHNVIDQGQMIIDNELKVHLMSELK